MTLTDRLPPLAAAQLDDAQRAAAAELIAGPRKAVKGPFIPLLRSPALMSRLQKVGEALRFDSVLPRRVTELTTLVVARHWSQQFEWAVHVPLALAEGTPTEVIEALAGGRRPTGMTDDEACAHDYAVELLTWQGVCDATWLTSVARWGERGVVELTSLIGYFALVSMVLNVAHTPAEAEVVPPLASLPF